MLKFSVQFCCLYRFINVFKTKWTTIDSIHYAYSIYITYQCLHIVIVLYFTGEFQKAEKICLAYSQKSDGKMSSDAGKSKKRRRTAPTRYRYYFHRNNSPTSNITNVYSTPFLSAIHRLLFFLYHKHMYVYCIVFWSNSFNKQVLLQHMWQGVTDVMLTCYSYSKCCDLKNILLCHPCTNCYHSNILLNLTYETDCCSPGPGQQELSSGSISDQSTQTAPTCWSTSVGKCPQFHQ